MAKIIVRKQEAQGDVPFDEQIWPVQAAIVVLGGYLGGCALAFGDPNGPWYLNTYTYLLAIPALIGLALWGVRYLDNKLFRRAIQLGALLSILAHLIVLLAVYFYGKLEVPAKPLVLKPEDQKKVQRPPLPKESLENVWFKEATQPKRDFERPVETKTPEVAQTTPTPRAETKPDEREPAPQPQPVAKPELTNKPSIEKRAEEAATAPRHSEQQSKLTRNMQKTDPQIAPQPVALPDPSKTETQLAQQPGAASNLEKKVTTPAEIKVQAAQADPTTSKPQPIAQLAKRTDDSPPQPNPASTPQLERKVNQPTIAPRTNVAVADETAKPKETQPDATKPAIVAATKQTAPAPEMTRNTSEPTPETNLTAQKEPNRRASTPDSPMQPATEPSQLARQIVKVNPAAAQTLAIRSDATAARESPAKVAARDTPIERAVTKVEVRPTTAQPADQPTPTPSPSVAARTQAQPSEVKPSESVAAVQRTVQTPKIEVQVAAAQAQPNANPNNTGSALAAQNAAASKQATAAPQVAVNNPRPTPAVAATQPAVESGSRQETPEKIENPTPAAAQIARAATKSPAPAVAAVTTPEATAEAAANPATISARQAAAEKSATEVNIAAKANAPSAEPAQPSSAAVAQTQAIARTQAANSEPVPQSTTSPSPARSAVASALSRPTTADAPQLAAASAQTNAQGTPGPASATVSKQAGASSQLAQKIAEPSPETPLEVKAETITRQQPGTSAQTLAQTPTPTTTVERRVQKSQPLASSVAAADPTPTRAPTSAEGTPSASEAAVARQSKPGTATIASANAQPTTTASDSAQPARAAVARATLSQTPTIDPTAAPSASPSRTALTAAAPTSPQAIESPAGAESARATDHPSNEPARMVLSKSIAGTAGIGSDINLDRGLPAPTSPARVASASAKRAEAVQNSPTGPALAPSETPQVARSQAGGAVPSSTVAANAGELATTPGAAQASELTASASASITRNSSNATKADFSAAAGAMDLDTGATQIVSSIGAGRAAGGGQPELNPNTQARALARTTPGGAPAMSITAAAVGPDPAAPRGSGGGQPPVIEASPTAAAVVKTNAGGSRPMSGGPASDAPAGPTAEAARAEMVASAEVGRATPVESAPAAAQAGGGNERPSRASTGQAIVLNSQANVPAVTGGPMAGMGPTVAGGGQAAPLEATASAAATRTESGGVPEIGGRSVAAEVGAPAETRSVAAIGAARSSAQETGPAAPAAASGAPALARSGAPSPLAATAQAAVPLPGNPSPAGPVAGGAPAVEASAAGAQVARAQPAGGAPVGGGLASKEDEQVGPVALAPGGDLIASLEQGRANTTDAQPGLPQAESGRGSPSRANGARSAPSTSQGANVQLAGGPMPSGGPSSSGNPAGIPLDAAGVAATRGAVGVVGPSGASAPGADVGPVPLDAPVGGPAISAVGTQKASSADDAGPLPLDMANAGAPLKRAERPGIPVGGAIGAVAVNVPAPGPMNPERTSTQPDMAQLAGNVSAGPTTKTSAGAVALAADAPEGPGGIGAEVTPDIGVITRQSQKESETLAFAPSRFLRQKAGGIPSINTTAVISADAFAQRRSASLRRGDTSGGNIGRPPRATEEAIELGLQFLTRHQMPDGSWSLVNYTNGRPGYNNERLPQLSSDTAATGMSLLCYFGAGYHHKDDRYQQEVARGLMWLVRNQKADGNLYVSQDELSNQSAALYSHAIAAIALCEAYGMTQDPDLKEPAQKALDFIVAAQHKERGGWRYSPGTGADTSVSGWMVMALKSGQLSNLKVDPQVYEKAKKWLATAKGPPGQEHLYVYNPYAPDTEAQKHGKKPTKTMTAVGMLTNMYLGANRNDSQMQRGADYLLTSLPALGDPRNPQRDTYYWYYATQVMFHMKGDYWKKWNDQLHPLLTNSQVRTGPLAGSWDPYGTVPDRWAHYGGRVYITAMNLLSLEVTYRHLPIYEETAK